MGVAKQIDQNLLSNPWGFDVMREFEKMFGCDRLYRKKISNLPPPKLEPYSLPAPIPQWPPGQGFGSGTINLGEIEVIKITSFQHVWSASLSWDKKKDIGFYKPVDIPDGYHSLGHYCQLNNNNLQGYVLAARDVTSCSPDALQRPLDFLLVWSLDDGNNNNNGDEDYGYFWLPLAPEGYVPMGFLVTTNSEKPDADEVRCVRADLTDGCETHHLVLDITSRFPNLPFRVWSMRPCNRGMAGRGVPVGTFFCSTYWGLGEELYISCLKNFDPTLHAMPNLDQVHALIEHYGPTVYFHPQETYFPCSVSWFFENGAMLYKAGETTGKPIDPDGSNLPAGGENDRGFWIDLPNDGRRKSVKHGNLESAKLYAHAKPALGGTFTDIALWIFCPFNGPATLKAGFISIALPRTGQHVGDWEHVTLRISNFTGALQSMYFSQHSGGEWVEAWNLEYISGNKPIVYSSRSGHASFPHPGTYIQGSPKLGIGPRNDAAGSRYFVDSSVNYEIVAAEYLGEGVVAEPPWLQYMRLWGPIIVYGSRSELDKMVPRLPFKVWESVHSLVAKFPGELYGEEGPTGPKEKNMWVGDERG